MIWCFLPCIGVCGHSCVHTCEHEHVYMCAPICITMLFPRYRSHSIFYKEPLSFLFVVLFSKLFSLMYKWDVTSLHKMQERVSNVECGPSVQYTCCVILMCSCYIAGCGHFGEIPSRDDIVEVEERSVRWLSAIAATTWMNAGPLSRQMLPYDSNSKDALGIAYSYFV